MKNSVIDLNIWWKRIQREKISTWKKFLVSLVIMKMQAEITIKYCLPHIGMSTMQRLTVPGIASI